LEAVFEELKADRGESREQAQEGGDVDAAPGVNRAALVRLTQAGCGVGNLF
jgi:hypothetical protein